MTELAKRLRALTERAESGALTDKDKIELRRLAENEGEKNLAAKLDDLAKLAEKGDLSPQARSELAALGAQIAEGMIARHEFDRLTPLARADLLRHGVRVVDAPPPIEKRDLREGEISRAQFDGLSAGEKMEKIRAGVRIVDLPGGQYE